jgi:hypothetical protein
VVLLAFFAGVKQNFIEGLHFGDFGEEDLVLGFDEFVVEGGAVVVLEGFDELVLLHGSIII